MSAGRRRIAHVITRLELGGAQQNTLYCTAHHDRARYDVSLLAGAGGLLDGEARAIADARVDLVPWLRHEIAPSADVAALVRLVAWLRRHRIELVHTHSSKAGILGRFAAAAAGVPRVVHTVHGWSFNETQPPALRGLYVGLERAAAAVSDRLLVVAARNRADGLGRGIGRPAQYRVLRSGIDPTGFAPGGDGRTRVRRELGVGDDDVLVGTVGNLKAQKAPLDWVAAAAAAAGREPRLRYALAGDGPLRPEVESAIAAAGLGGRVALLGWRRDVADLYRAFDVFLLTSRFEGLPRSVLQAMAAEVPVVATAVDGTPEVVRDGVTGLTVPPGDPAAAAAAVLRLVAEPALGPACVAAARDLLGREFDIRHMLADLETIYDELLAGV